MPLSSPARVVLLGTDVGGVQTGVASGASIPVNVSSSQNLAWYFQSFGTFTAGTLVIEEADYYPDSPPYPGTWALAQTVLFSDFSGGVQRKIQFPLGAYAYVRVRISVPLVGSTALVTLRHW